MAEQGAGTGSAVAECIDGEAGAGAAAAARVPASAVQVTAQVRY